MPSQWTLVSLISGACTAVLAYNATLCRCTYLWGILRRAVTHAEHSSSFVPLRVKRRRPLLAVTQHVAL